LPDRLSIVSLDPRSALGLAEFVAALLSLVIVIWPFKVG